MKKVKKYKMLQLDEEIHTMLRNYAKQHGFIMKAYVQALIKQSIANNKKR